LFTAENKAQLLAKEKTQVQYENLKQHLNPHFLFNSLSSLSSLIEIDPKMAGRFLGSLSKIYRYILQSKDKDTVPLKDEIAFVQSFIALQQTRFEQGLQVHIHIDESDYHRHIVPVTLQNLIENAIKHNIIDEENILQIDISTADDYLVVKNKMQLKKFVETSNNQGLENLKHLYSYLSEKPLQYNREDEYFVVKIPLL
jgi:LytS/YehU family sensor histidine kinase